MDIIIYIIIGLVYYSISTGYAYYHLKSNMIIFSIGWLLFTILFPIDLLIVIGKIGNRLARFLDKIE